MRGDRLRKRQDNAATLLAGPADHPDRAREVLGGEPLRLEYRQEVALREAIEQEGEARALGHVRAHDRVALDAHPPGAAEAAGVTSRVVVP